LEDNSDLLRQEATFKLKVKLLACVAKVGSDQAKVVLLFDLVDVPILDLMKLERYAFKVELNEDNFEVDFQLKHDATNL